nr:unnamed protein product [Digitaria exilis]
MPTCRLNAGLAHQPASQRWEQTSQLQPQSFPAQPAEQEAIRRPGGEASNDTDSWALGTVRLQKMAPFAHCFPARSTPSSRLNLSPNHQLRRPASLINKSQKASIFMGKHAEDPPWLKPESHGTLASFLQQLAAGATLWICQ